MMDLNLIVMAGRLAADPEVQTFASGATLVKLLVTVRSTEPRRRIDVLPVVQWDPDEDSDAYDLHRGDRVWIAGSVQRRFWSAEAGRTSRVEIVAHDIQRQTQTESAITEGGVDDVSQN
jgi:single-stranded DNA-binding protein